MGAPPQSQMPSVRDMPMVAPRPACYSDSVLEQAKAARLTPDATPCGRAATVPPVPFRSPAGAASALAAATPPALVRPARTPRRAPPRAA